MMTQELPSRQIHLDFHTSEHIAGIGAAFEPEAFADTLAKAHVNSVTCFARCHHGWFYYDTKAFPEMRHPHLTRDLLREQIEACHAQGIQVPIYTSIEWDYAMSRQHPDWVVVGPDGRLEGTPPYEPGFYRYLCVNTPYVEYLKAHIHEILSTLPTDGLFLDIVKPMDCSCYYCRAEMEAEGLDPSDKEARKQFGVKVLNRFMDGMAAFIREHNTECRIFFNAGHIGPRLREVSSVFTHYELESLPSGGWGYLHFPLTARYARTLNKNILGMTGKFHTSWGDFHSFKNRQALEFECFTMLALGAKCSVGDQLHPSGRICPHTYDLIGSVYAQVEEKEPWCKGAEPLTEIAVLSPEAFSLDGGHNAVPTESFGCVAMLQEPASPTDMPGQPVYQFNVVDSHEDFSAYRVLVLPDTIPVSSELAKRLQDYLEQGGAILASYKSGLRLDGSGFALVEFGIRLKGDAPYSPDFIKPSGPIGAGLPETEHVMYMRGLEVKVEKGAKVLAKATEPYFNRTFDHFCSHLHTPSAGKEAYPAVVQRGKLIYFAHPVFTQYRRNAPSWCKRMVMNALNMLLPDPLLRIEGPTTLRATVNAQPAQNRWIVHLIHYIPERRGEAFDTIEDIIPLYDVSVSVRTPKQVKRVVCQPVNVQMPFEERSGRVEFIIPLLEGHQMVAIEYA